MRNSSVDCRWLRDSSRITAPEHGASSRLSRATTVDLPGLSRAVEQQPAVPAIQDIASCHGSGSKPRRTHDVLQDLKIHRAKLLGWMIAAPGNSADVCVVASPLRGRIKVGGRSDYD